jgi:hypothetical protein
MIGYVTVRHPHRIGEVVAAIPTGKTRTEERERKEIEVRVITAKSNLDTLWIRRDDLLT